MLPPIHLIMRPAVVGAILRSPGHARRHRESGERRIAPTLDGKVATMLGRQVATMMLGGQMATRTAGVYGSTPQEITNYREQEREAWGE